MLPAAAQSIAETKHPGRHLAKHETKHLEKNSGNHEKSQSKLIQSPLLAAMRVELDRSFANLKNAGEAPLYFLSYSLYDVESLTVQADYAFIRKKTTTIHAVLISICGWAALKLTAIKLRDNDLGLIMDFGSGGPAFPLGDDQAAIRTALWQRTDSAFKKAQKKFRKVVTNKGVKVEEDDTSDDFSLEKPHSETLPSSSFSPDRSAWEERVRRLSALYKLYPAVQDSNISFSASKTKHYLVTSEGTNIVDERIQYRISSTVTATASDGMKIWLSTMASRQVPAETR
jgi:hypothetical protein